MRSKTSFFNKTLFGKNISRFWPVWAVYLLYLLLMVPFAQFNLTRGSYGGDSVYMGYQVLRTVIGGFPIILDAIASCATAMAVFSYLYAPRTAGAVACLPVKREGAFFSNMMSGLVWLIGANVVAAAVMLLVEISAGTVGISYLLMWIAASSMRILFFYGMSCFLAMLTGNKFILPVAFVGVNGMFAVAELCIDSIVSELLDGVMSPSVFPRWLTPVWELMESNVRVKNPDDTIDLACALDFPKGTDLVFNSWDKYGAYAVVGVIFIVLGMLLIRKRRMESAGDVISVRILKPIFKYFLAVMCALCIGQLLYGVIFTGTDLPRLPCMLVCTVVGAAIGYFAAAMLNAKSFKVRNQFAGFVAVAVVAAAGIGCIGLDLFNIRGYIPEASDVNAVTVSFFGDEAKLTEPELIDETEELHRLLCEESVPNDGPMSNPVYIEYELKNGRTVQRRYELYYNNKGDQTAGSAAEKFEKLWNNKDVVIARYTTIYLRENTRLSPECIDYAYVEYSRNGGEYLSSELTKNQAYELYVNCILPDAEDGKIGKMKLGDMDASKYEGYGALYVSIMFSNGEYVVDSTQLTVTKEAERTVQYLSELNPEMAKLVETALK